MKKIIFYDEEKYLFILFLKIYQYFLLITTNFLACIN